MRESGRMVPLGIRVYPASDCTPTLASMQPRLIPLLAILVLVGGGAGWLAWGRGGTRATAPQPGAGRAAPAPAGTPSASPAEAATENRQATRTAASPPTPAAEESSAAAPEPPQPLPGAGVTAIYGDSEVLQDFYRGIDTDGRRSRLQELETALGEYNGDPADRREFAKYQALKEELLWLQAHPDP